MKKWILFLFFASPLYADPGQVLIIGSDPAGFIQNTLTPTTTTQSYNVQFGTVTDQLTITGGTVTITNAGSLTASNVSWTIDPATGIALKDNGSLYLIYPSTSIFNLSDITISTNVLMNTTGYAFSMGASETWSFEFNFFMTGVTGGTKFGFNGPVGSTVTAVVFGDTAAVGTFSAASITALNTADSVAFVTTAAAILVRITGTMQTSLTAGTLNLMWQSVTSNNTSTIKAGSYMKANRLQ